jgi:hypothetical protein
MSETNKGVICNCKVLSQGITTERSEVVIPYQMPLPNPPKRA